MRKCLVYRMNSYDQCNHLIASLHVITAIFPGGPELAGTRMSPFWILLELRMMEVVVTTGPIRRAELQSNRHHQQPNTQRFTGRMPFPSPNQQCQSSGGWLVVTSELHSMYLQTAQSNKLANVDIKSCMAQLSAARKELHSKWTVAGLS